MGNLSYTAAEKTEWLSRISNSQYITDGGDPSYLPFSGSWNRLVYGNTGNGDSMASGAIAFKNNIYVGGLWDGSTNTAGIRDYGDRFEPHFYAHGVTGCSIIYFLYGTGNVPYEWEDANVAGNVYGRKVIDYLLVHIGVTLNTFTSEAYFKDQPWYKTAGFLLKMVKAYGLTRDLATAGEQTTIDNYFSVHAHWYSESIHASLDVLFPERYNDEYGSDTNDHTYASNAAMFADQGSQTTGQYCYTPESDLSQWKYLGTTNGDITDYTKVRGRCAADRLNVGWGYHAGEYTHQTSDGTKGNVIYAPMRYYNNRRANCVNFWGHVGVLLDDTTLKNTAKRYVEEWLKFSVFPDGTTGEYERNGNYSTNFEGINYNTINIQVAVMLADVFARNGDTSLYTFETSEGFHSTVGASKTIKKTIERYHAHILQTDVWYYCNEYREGGPVTRTEDRKLDLIDSNDSNRQWIAELWFSPVANMYYQEASWPDIYTHQAGGTPAYTGRYGTAGPLPYPWRGQEYVIPEIPFCFMEMESVDVFGNYEAPPVPVEAGSIKYRRRRGNRKGATPFGQGSALN
jgi:hypothetical protein